MLQADFLSRFTCLGDRCEDTCCQNWSMQVDEPTRARYAAEAPELLPDVVQAEETGGWIMRKDEKTGFCVRLEGGMCGIHKQYGDRMLGDACHFYPRVTRSLGTQVLMTATLSCPEIARLTLLTDPTPATEVADGRTPTSLKNYLPPNMSETDALTTHRAFLSATTDSAPPEQILLRIIRASHSLALLQQESWHILTGFYLTDADLRIPPAQENINDPFNLLHMLCGLVSASQKPASPRLHKTLSDIETALSATLDWKNVAITTTDASLPAWQHIRELSATHAAHYAPILRRWLHLQLSMGLHPFSGFGKTLPDRATLLGVRFACIKLALFSAHAVQNQPLPNDDIIRIIQSLSRLLDHLGDPTLLTAICTETGWTNEARLHGLTAF